MTEVVTIATPELGDRSYLAHDGAVAVAIDPQRDIDRILQAAEAAGVEIVGVAETHLHNDYVSGGRELASVTGATHLVAGGEEVAFSCVPVRGGEGYRFGRLVVNALATPGHTAHHIAYSVGDEGGAEVVFSGGSLLFGAVGRTDLVAPEHTEALTRDQFRSAHRLAEELADQVIVCPTHGFGSFCSSTAPSEAQSSTIGAEKGGNLVFGVDDEDAFVKTLISGLSAYPRYYRHMAVINRAGPAPIDLRTAPQIDVEELLGRIESGEWVVDLRERRAFASAHVPRTISVELATSFSTYLGWTVPWHTPVTLIGDNREQVSEAQRDLARIGIDRPAGMALWEPARLSTVGLASYPVADFAALRSALGRDNVSVLDVRRDDEWEQGHLETALHIHLPDLEDRMDEVPEEQVWVHCATGYRSAIAASLLARAGRDPVLIDDDWERAAEVGLSMTR